MTIAVIGAGAAGLMAAVSAAIHNKDAKIFLFDKNPSAGKKLLRTGSGRGNIGNEHQSISCFHGNDEDFYNKVITSHPLSFLLSVFDELNIDITVKDGYIYPRNQQAKSVRDAFITKLESLGNVRFLGSKEIISISYEKTGFVLNTDGWHYEADKVILACGGASAPDTGSDGSAYKLAQSFGHKLITPYPALVPLVCKKDPLFKTSKERMSASVSYKGHTATGELQLTEYGVSGIAVFQISRFVSMDLINGEKPVISINFFPESDSDHVYDMLLKRASSGGRYILNTLLPEEMAKSIIKSNSLDSVDIPSAESIRALSDLLTDYRLYVTDTKGFERSQVTAGGIDTSDIDPQTMGSFLRKGLYICGELLDVDGDCGGYNLQWAFTGGYIAGEAAAADD
ncbi:MAG: aminoacetone oxidase family FAD-binding enzyme [Lachnospiraceae bacterium]|nr:aminoacetone oxidase family FAD-binding enzyme [Lachnospiraceae bacterium]